MYSNQLTGTVPAELGELTSLALLCVRAASQIRGLSTPTLSRRAYVAAE
jgi:hypothetical protein